MSARRPLLSPFFSVDKELEGFNITVGLDEAVQMLPNLPAAEDTVVNIAY
jgi:hypothetical protein